MERSGSIPAQRTRTSTLEAPRPETCPFCVIGIGHVGHVPAGVVRVGQDYGDRG